MGLYLKNAWYKTAFKVPTGTHLLVNRTVLLPASLISVLPVVQSANSKFLGAWTKEKIQIVQNCNLI